MAISAATVTGDFSGFINPERAGAIFERTRQLSVVQRLARRVPLGIAGTEVPVVTGRPQAGWVSEGQQKPATAGTMTLKTMAPKKIAAIAIVSAEVVRANPGNYIELFRNDIAEAFAVAFDRAALHDEGPDGTGGGGPFSTYLAQTTKAQEIGATSQANGGIFVDLTEAMRDIVSDVDANGRRYRLTGWALDTVLEPSFWGQVDTTGHPIWTNLPENVAQTAPLGGGTLMNRPAFFGEGVASANLTAVVGFAGDWSQAVWGQIGGISYDISTQATATINGSLVSLWENNLVGIRAETEFGFLLNDADAFVELTNVGNAPVTSS
jgi:HK97 family phage major capsid protein